MTPDDVERAIGSGRLAVGSWVELEGYRGRYQVMERPGGEWPVVCTLVPVTRHPTRYGERAVWMLRCLPHDSDRIQHVGAVGGGVVPFFVEHLKSFLTAVEARGAQRASIQPRKKLIAGF